MPTSDRNHAAFPVRASLVVIGLMCTLPFLQPKHSNPLTSFYSECLAFVLGCIALFPLALARYNEPLRVPRIALVPLLLIFVLVVHLVLLKAAYPQQILLAMAYLAWAYALIVVSSLVAREIGLETMAAALAWFVLAGGLLSTLAGILQCYNLRGFLEPVIATKILPVVYGNLGQPNHFADYVGLALASLVLLYALGRLRLVVAVVLCAPMLFVMALSGSRSPWLYFAAMAILAVYWYRKSKTPQALRAMRFTLALLPGFACANGLAVLPWFAPPTAQVTDVDRLFELATTQSARLELWHEAWLMFLRHPLLGVGWGQFAWHYFLLGGTLPGVSLNGLYNHAHNLFFQLLAETGLAGVAPVAVGLGLWMFTGTRLLNKPEGWWLAALFSILGIHSMVEYPLWYAYFLGIASVVLGMGEVRFFEVRKMGLVRAGTVAFIGSGIVVAALMLGEYMRLESVLYARYAHATRAQLVRAQEEMMGVRAGFFLAPYVELAYARDVALTMHDIRQKLEFTGRVMRFAPTGMVAYRDAALYALNGDAAQAARLLDHAVATYPWMLSDFYEEFRHTRTGNQPAQAAFERALQSRITKQRATAAGHRR